MRDITVYHEGIMFRSSKEALEQATQRINEIAKKESYLSGDDILNMLYEELGISKPYHWSSI